MTNDETRVDLRQVIIGTALLITAGFALLFIDMPVARICAKEAAPREIQAILDRAEVFGHAYGVAVVALTIWFVSPAKRIWLPRFLVSAYGAGLAADLGKISVWRYRPCAYDLTGGVTDSFVGSIFSGNFLASSGDLHTVIDSAHHSLPSAHTATAVAAAMILGRIYPHAKGWFVALAVLVAANRVEGGAHFASDVCWGAAVGYAMHSFVLRGGWLRNSLIKLERYIAERSPCIAMAK